MRVGVVRLLGMRSSTWMKLTAEQRRELEALLARPTTPHGHARRVQVILLSAEGRSGVDIANAVGLSKFQVSRIRRRFDEGGVAGLADQPRPGRGNRTPDALVKKVIAKVMTPPPPGYSHWSTPLLARHFPLGKSVLHKILQANDLKPHLSRTFKLSKDPKFAEKVEDVVGLYLNPPEKAVVISIDEKTQVQALERTQPSLPLRRGKVERYTHDYKRNGVVDLYAALDVATGEVFGRCTESHTGADFLAFMKALAREYPTQELHAIVDNSSTHTTPAVQQWLAENPRIKMHFTPTSASWLNQVETFFSVLTRRSLTRTSFPSKGALKKHIRAFLRQWNATAKPFVWKKDAHTILRDHRRIVAGISREEH